MVMSSMKLKQSFIRKPTLGLALGGGGARGLAHIGVLKVLCAENIAIDFLSGTSMGGIVAAFYACGIPLDRLEDEAKRMGRLTEIGKLVDRTIAKLDFILNGDNVQDYFSKVIGKERTFESLPIPLALAAVDMGSASEVTLQSGNLVEALNATMGLPGIVEPVRRNGMTLVDGGSLNNVPADLVRSMGAEVVVAVDVSPDVNDREFWESQKLPGIATANWRSNAIMVANFTKAKLQKAQVEIVIRPELDNRITTLSGFKYADEVIAAGARAAWEFLPQLRKLLESRFFLARPKRKPAEAMQL